MADAITMQGLIDANLDVETLGEVANEDKVVVSRLGLEYPSAPMASRLILEQGTIDATLFKTKADLDADTTLVDDDFALVYNDDDVDLNGYYQKQSGVWEYLPYNIQRKASGAIAAAKQEAIEAAAMDATSKADSAKAEAIEFAKKNTLEKTKALASSGGESLATFVDANDDVVANLDNQAVFNAEDFATGRTTLNTVGGLIMRQDLPDYLYAFVDASGNIVDGMRTDGTIDSAGTTSSNGIAEMRANILDSADMTAAGLALDAPYLNKDPLKYEVIVSDYGEDGTLHQRMPNACRISDTRICVFYTQFSSANLDTRDGRLVARFVDFDLENQTSTVSATMFIDPANGTTTGVLSRNPVLLELKDKIVLLFNDDKIPKQLESYDDGATWVNLKSINLPDNDFKYITLNACEKITAGKYAGRVCLAIQNGVDGAGREFGVFYSDDDCETWQEGARMSSYDAFPEIGTEHTNEISMTLDASQNLIFAFRHTALDMSLRKVLWAKSFDGGKTIVPYGFNPNVPTSVSTFGMRQFAPTTIDNVPKVIFSNPSSPSNTRKDFKVRVSYDNCRSFISEYSPYDPEQHVGYSAILPLSNDTFALIVEHGVVQQEQSIRVIFLNLAEII